VYSVGAYLAYVIVRVEGWSWFAAGPAAVLGSAVLGVAMEVAVYRPLRRKGANALALLVASLGLLTVVQNLLSLLFGDATLVLRAGLVKEGLEFLGARLTPIQIAAVGVNLALTLGLWLWLERTRSGKLVRAVSNDKNLSLVAGIDSDAVVRNVFAVGSALAAVAAILAGCDTDLSPAMGFGALLMGVVAVVIGGVTSIPGVLLGGLGVGLAQHLGALVLSTAWQDFIVYSLLALFLVMKPQGILGRPPQRELV
jgi:branched-subunit amino acid ABC-type transport system permease component